MKRFRKILLTTLIAGTLVFGSFDVSAIAANGKEAKISEESKDNSSGEKSSEKRSSEEKNSEEKTSGEKSSEEKSSEEKSSEGKTSGEKSSAEKSSEEKDSEEKTSEDKSSEEKTSEGKTSEEKSSEEKSFEDKDSEDKNSGEKSSEEKNSEEKNSGEKSSEGKSSEAEKPEGESSEEKSDEKQESSSDTKQDSESRKEEAPEQKEETADSGKTEEASPESDSSTSLTGEDSGNNPSEETVSEESKKSAGTNDSNTEKNEADQGTDKEDKDNKDNKDNKDKGTDSAGAGKESEKGNSDPEGTTSGESKITEEKADGETVSVQSNEASGDSDSKSDPVAAAAVPDNSQVAEERSSVTNSGSEIPGVFSYAYVDNTVNSVESSVTVTGDVKVDNLREPTSNWWEQYPSLPQELIDVINAIVDTSSHTSAEGIMALAHPNYPTSSKDENYVAGSGASASIDVGGNLEVEGRDKATGIAAGALGTGNEASISVKGDVNATAGDTVIGVDVRTRKDGTATVTIGGDLQALSTGEDSADKTSGIKADNVSGKVDISVDGSIVSSGAGIRSTGKGTGNAGTSSIAVKGDVEAGTTGVYLKNGTDDKEAALANHDILVENVLSGKEQGILVSRDSVEGLTRVDDNGNTVDRGGAVDITVWQIVENDRGNVAEVKTKDGYKAAKNVEKAIKYIIKFEQPDEGATLSVTDSAKKKLAKSHGFEVAHETERVLLKVDLKAGYKILGAYNGKGEKTELLMDNEGNYYIDVPKGGGVYLTVDLELEEEPEDDDTEQEEEPVDPPVDPNPVVDDSPDEEGVQEDEEDKEDKEEEEQKEEEEEQKEEEEEEEEESAAPSEEAEEDTPSDTDEKKADSSEKSGKHRSSDDNDEEDDEDSGSYKSPKTADENQTGLWILLAAAAGFGLVTALIGKKRSYR